MIETMAEALPAVLAVLESAFPLTEGGGAESQLRTLAIELTRRGQAIEVVVPMVAGGPQLRSELVDGIRVTRIPYPKLHWLGGAWMLAGLFWLLVSRRRDYQVIHAHIGGNMAAVASLAGRWLGKPVLVKLTGMTEMRGGILDPARPWRARLRGWAMRRCSAFQATSTRIAGALVEQGFDPSKVMLLPNAVDIGRFAAVQPDPARRELLRRGRQLVGIFVGRLEPEKELGLLVEAWARAFATSEDARLLLVGDGSQRAGLRARAVELGVADQLVFVGATGEVEQYLAAADFAVLTSRFEGLSNALLEYMAAGLPVVGSRISGTEDWVVDGDTGWLFEAGDVVALSRTLQAVRDSSPDEVRRRGERGQDRVRQGASIPAVVGALQATYRRLGAPGADHPPPRSEAR